MFLKQSFKKSVIVTSYLIMPVTGIIGVGYACLGAQTVVALYVAAHFWLIRLIARVSSTS